MVRFLANPHVGMLFLLPPMAETLRLNGRARLPSAARILRDHAGLDAPVAQLDAGLRQGYRETLY